MTKNAAYISLTLCFFLAQISVSLMSIFFILSFLLVLFSNRWQFQWNNIVSNQAALSFWLLGALYIVGIFYSTATSHYIIKDLHKQHWLYITPFLIAFIADETWRKHMINAFLIAMSITLLLSMAKWIFHLNYSALTKLIHVGPQERASVFTHHIVQSYAMTIAAFIIAYRFLFLEKNRALYLILFILMTIDILFMSKSKTGYLTFLILLLYASVVRFGWKSLFYTVFLSIFVVTAAFFLNAGLHERITKMVHDYQHYSQTKKLSSTTQRIEMIHIAEKMIRERPWFGYGTGGIQTALPKVVPAQERILNPHTSYVESIYLNALLQFGVFGLLILCIAVGMQIKASFALPHFYRYLIHLVLLSTFFGGLFNMFLDSFPIVHIYALFAAVCFSRHNAQ